MTPAVPGLVVVAYVRDLAVSRGFYRLLGFLDQPGESNAGPAWAALRRADCALLLATSPPAAGRTPLALRVLVEDVDAVIRALRDGGFDVSSTAGPGALDGRAMAFDPDGNVVLLGQPGWPPGPAPDGSPGSWPDRSLVTEVTAALAERPEGPASCQVRDLDAAPCPQEATVKLADSAGDSVWACLDHADEILVTVRGAFIASQGERGLASFRARRRGPASR